MKIRSLRSCKINAPATKNDRLGARVESALKPVPPLQANDFSWWDRRFRLSASNISQLLTVAARLACHGHLPSRNGEGAVAAGSVITFGGPQSHRDSLGANGTKRHSPFRATTVRSCEIFENGRRNRLPHRCKQSTSHGGAGAFACQMPFISQLLRVIYCNKGAR